MLKSFGVLFVILNLTSFGVWTFQLLDNIPGDDVLLFTKDGQICYYNDTQLTDDVCFMDFSDREANVIQLEMIKSKDMLIVSYNEHIYQIGMTEAAQDSNKLLTFSAGVLRDISVDWISENIYYVDNTTATIKVVNFNGLHPVNVLESQPGNQYLACVVDPIGRKLYYTWYNNTHTYIGRSNLDGTNPSVIFQTNDAKPFNLEMDHGAGRLYWTDPAYNSVESLDTTTLEHRVLFENVEDTPYDITVNEDSVIWTQHTNIFNIIYESKITTTSKENGSHVTYDYHVTIYSVYDVLWYGAYNQPPGTNGCAGSNNGGCSQICFATTQTEVICKCSLGYVLDSDGKTCNPVEITIGESTLFMTDLSMGGFAIDVNTRRTSALPYILGQDNIFQMAVDYDRQLVFTYSLSSGLIKSHRMDGSEDHMIYNVTEESHQISSFFIDTDLQLIFYNDVANYRIVKLNYDGSGRTVIQEDFNIYSIALDRKKRHIYAGVRESFWEYGEIIRMDYDGSNMQTLLHGSTDTHVQSPTGLTLDLSNNRMYWVDGPYVIRSSLNGMEPATFLRDTTTINFLVDTVLINGYLYVTDWQGNNQLRRINVERFDEIQPFGSRDFLHTSSIAAPVKMLSTSAGRTTPNVATAQTPVRTTQAPEPTVQTPVRTTQAPEPTAQTPEPTAQTPEPTAQTPEPTAQTPVRPITMQPTNAPVTRRTTTTPSVDGSSTTNTGQGNGGVVGAQGGTSTSNSGLVAGVVIACIVIAIIVVVVLVAVYMYLRRYRGPDGATHLVEENTAIENPGYMASEDMFTSQNLEAGKPAESPYSNAIGGDLPPKAGGGNAYESVKFESSHGTAYANINFGTKA